MKKAYSIIEHSEFTMKNILFPLTILAFSVSTFAQSDEINISASFTQSIELRVIGNSSLNFTFSTISHYQGGQHKSNNAVGFEVASSTSFEVQAQFTPFTNESGDQIDIDNVTYHIGIPPDKVSEWGKRWDLPKPVEELVNRISGSLHIYGFFVASSSPQTMITPGPEGNAGGFDENRFYLTICIGWWNHIKRIGKPQLLDQNIQPGTYNCTMTLTAIPVII